MAFLAAGLLALSSCKGALEGIDAKANVPVPDKLVNKMKAYGMTTSSPIMLRIFKQENVLEVWKRKDTGRYAKLTEYEICKWSGKLGPKHKEGDRQAPEGFYFVNKGLMNPKSQYHLAFNMGFPNAFDRAHGRTGSHLMVHGACSSAGCYSMTDEYVEEIYALARESFAGGQKAFQIQAFPFRMTAENMFKNRDHKEYAYWKMLKRGYDHFEITAVPPKVDVCEKRYVFNTQSDDPYAASAACPKLEMPKSLALAYAKTQSNYANRFEELLAKSESRDVTPLAPLTVDMALPGIAVIEPQPVIPVAPAEAPDAAAIADAETSDADATVTGGVTTKPES